MIKTLLLFPAIRFCIFTSIVNADVNVTAFDVDILLEMCADQHDLDMSNQASFELPHDRVFLEHKTLERFHCNNCSIHSIYKLSFSMLPQLKHLELNHNNLSYIHVNAFENNNLLQKLELIGNNLKRFNPEATLKHISLTCLILDQNPRFDINDVKIQLPWLVYFSCKHCNTSIITRSTMPQWEHLGHLHLSHNNINRIASDAFQDMIKLKHLNIDGNPELTELNFESKTLMNLSAESCGLQGKLNTSSFSSLEILNVRKNKISKLVEHGFEHNKFIKEILLDDNEIEKIPEKLLKTPLSELKTLCLDRNPLQPRDLLQNFVLQYTKRHLRRNCLDDYNLSLLFEYNLPPKTGRALYRKLEGIDSISSSSTFNRSSSEIVFIERAFFEDLNNITTVILDSNKNLRFPENDIFLKSDFIINLSMTYCDIAHIYKETFAELPNLMTINLRGNKIKTLNSVFIFKKNTHIKHLDFSENELMFIASNIFEDLQFLETLNLQRNHLLTFEPRNPMLVSGSLSVLDCQYCNLTQLDDIMLSGMPNLRQLNVSRSNITTVHKNAFGTTMHIQIVDLSHNNLQNFTLDLKNYKRRLFPSENAKDSGNQVLKHVLYCKHCNSTEVDNIMVSRNQNLTELYESLNNYISVHDNASDRIEHFLIVDLSHNNVRLDSGNCTQFERLYSSVNSEKFENQELAQIVSQFQSSKLHVTESKMSEEYNTSNGSFQQTFNFRLGIIVIKFVGMIHSFFKVMFN